MRSSGPPENEALIKRDRQRVGVLLNGRLGTRLVAIVMKGVDTGPVNGSVRFLAPVINCSSSPAFVTVAEQQSMHLRVIFVAAWGWYGGVMWVIIESREGKLPARRPPSA